jgi:hypothetical protein
MISSKTGSELGQLICSAGFAFAMRAESNLSLTRTNEQDQAEFPKQSIRDSEGIVGFSHEAFEIGDSVRIDKLMLIPTSRGTF